MSQVRLFVAVFALMVAAWLPLAAQISDGKVFALHSTWYTLGTNGGPIAKPDRSEPANLLVLANHEGIGQYALVDCGDGAAEQLAKVGVPLGKLNAIILSHVHFDHTGGPFALLGMRFQLLTPGVLTIYGPPGTKLVVSSLTDAMQVEAEGGRGYPNAPPLPAPESTVRVVEVGDGDSFKLGSVAVTVRRNSHYSYSKDSDESKRFQSLAFRFELPDRSLVYTGDTGPSREVEELAKAADFLFSEIEPTPAAIVDELRKSNPGLPEAVYQQATRHMLEQHLTAENLAQLAIRAE